MDKSKYKIIIRGIAQKNKVANKITAIPKNENLNSFPFHLNDLNLSAKSGSSTTIRMDMITVAPIKNAGLNTNFANVICHETNKKSPKAKSL